MKKRRILSALLAMALFLSQMSVSAYATDAVVTDDSAKDIFLNVDSDVTGYSSTELAKAVKMAYENLGGDVDDLRFKTSTTEIDTTDLSSWYVYDHYDTKYWGTNAQLAYEANVILPQSSGGYGTTLDHRPYYGMTEAVPANTVPTTISEIGTGSYTAGYAYYLKEHIYSTVDSTGKSSMNFYGYSSPAYADFLYYPASASSTKSVTFDINASAVITHSMKYGGFLVNANINGDTINGYLLLLEYYPLGSRVPATSLNAVYLYKLNNASISALHAGGLDSIPSANKELVAQDNTVAFSAMAHIELTIAPTSLTATIQALNSSGTLTGTAETLFDKAVILADTSGGNFGPYVNYSGHGCSSTSYFSYYNLKMSFSDATTSTTSALASLQYADYLQNSTSDRYFVNILGAAINDIDKDSGYIYLIQDQDISLFTNKSVGTNGAYLPAYYEDTTSTSIIDLAENIAKYLYGTIKGTVNDLVSIPTFSGIAADLELKSSTQASYIYRDLIGEGGIMIYANNLSIIPEGATTSNLVYTLIKPDGTVDTIVPTNYTKGTLTTICTVTNNITTWPVGQYVVHMDYKGTDDIPANAYFTIYEDITAPSVTVNTIVPDDTTATLNFINTDGSDGFGYNSNLASYAVTSSSSSTTAPLTSGLTKKSIAKGETSAVVNLPISNTDYYLWAFVWDAAGNVGSYCYTSSTITNYPIPTITAIPTANSIIYGQILLDSILSGGSAMYDGTVVTGTFSWTMASTLPEPGTRTYNVTFTPDSTESYVSTTCDVLLTIDKATPSIVLADEIKPYTGSTVSISAATVIGVSNSQAMVPGAVLYTYYTNAACTLKTTAANSGSAYIGGAPKYAGTYYVTASIDPDTYYMSANVDYAVTFVISTISSTDLMISDGNDMEKTYGDSSFQLSTGTTGSGTGYVTYASSDPLVASVTSDGYVTINSVGSATITATKASDGNYDAQTTSIDLDVNEKVVDYTISDNNKIYTGSAQYASVVPSVSSLVQGKDYTVTYIDEDSTPISKPIEKGTYLVKVSTINSNYTGITTGTFVISSTGQSQLQISGVPASSIEYGDSFTLSANGGSGTGTVTWAVTSGNEYAQVDETSGLVEITGVGNVTITATRASDANYDSQTASVTFTCVAKVIPVSATATGRNYDGTVGVDVDLETGIVGVSASAVSATVSTASAGKDKKVTITGVSIDNVNYKPESTTIYTTVTINSIDDTGLTISGMPSSITYGDKDFKLSAFSTGTGDVSWSSSDTDVVKVNSNTGVVTINGVGMATITAHKKSDGNYNAVSNDVDIIVEQQKVTYSVVNNTKPYSGGIQYATVAPNVRSLVEGIDYIVTYSQDGEPIEEPTEAGIYDINILTINDNYSAEYEGAVMTIQEVDQTYTLEIGGLPHYIEYEDTFALYANGGNGSGKVTWEVTTGSTIAVVNETNGMVSINGVGTVTITAIKAADGNYNEQTQSVTFNTQKKQINISISGTAKTFNGKVQSVNITGTKTVNNDFDDITEVSYVMQSNGTQSQFRDVGVYNVEVFIAEGYEDLYILEGNTTNVASIKKANLTIKADDLTKVYGDQNPELTMSYSLLGTDEEINLPIINCIADETSEVGSYGIVISYDGEHDNDNYNIILVDGILTVVQREVTVNWQNTTSYEYDNSEHMVIAAIGNLVNADEISFDYSDNANTNVGSYEAEIINILGTKVANYKLPESGLTKDWEITKADLDITADDKSVTYGDMDPTYTATYSTLLGNDTVASLTGELEFACDYTSASNTGNYVIEPSGFTSDNYNITFNNGNVIVGKATPIITISNKTEAYKGEVIEIGTATVNGINNETITSGIFYTYYSDKACTTETTIDNGALSNGTAPSKSGVYYVKVSVLESINYSAASKVVTLNIYVPSSGGGGSYVVDDVIINVASGANGSITPSGEITIASGSNQTFKITADEGYKISDVFVDGESVGEVSSYTFTNVTSSHTIAVTFEKKSEINSFDDVSESDWFYDAVCYLSNAGLMGGTSEKTFQPNLETTRGMIVTILYRLEGENGVTKDSGFYDVERGTWYNDAVSWGEENGIVKGYSSESFGPNDNITREQMAAILYRYANFKGYDTNKNVELSKYSDAGDISSYALPSMKWAVAEGLITGTTTTTLSPTGAATRAQLATIVMRFIENITK